MALGRATTAADFAQLGLECEPANATLLALFAEASEMRRVQRANEAAVLAAAEARAARLDAVRAAVRARGLVVGPPQFADMRRTDADPYVDAEDGSGGPDGTLHWPVLLLYPEYGTSDYLEDVSEDAPVGAVLGAVLPLGDGGPAAAPPGWDARGEYRCDNVELLLRTHPVAPAPLEEAWVRRGGAGGDGGDDSAAAPAVSKPSGQPQRWVRVPPTARLADVIASAGYVVADVPVLYAVARSSAFYAELLRRLPGGALRELSPPTREAAGGGGPRGGAH